MAVVSRDLKHKTRSRWSVGVLTVATYLLALLAFAVLAQHALGWGTRRVDDLRYGMPRRVHLQGVVGHGDDPAHPTHIITLNLDGQISVVLLPSGDTSNLQTFPGPYLVGDDGPYAVPHPALHDVTGDGLVDLVVTVRNEAIVYVNEEATFRLLTPEERAQLATQLTDLP